MFWDRGRGGRDSEKSGCSEEVRGGEIAYVSEVEEVRVEPICTLGSPLYYLGENFAIVLAEHSLSTERTG